MPKPKHPLRMPQAQKVVPADLDTSSHDNVEPRGLRHEHQQHRGATKEATHGWVLLRTMVFVRGCGLHGGHSKPQWQYAVLNSLIACRGWLT
eukprot:4968789-Amphidinium_carterae.1